MSEEIVDIEYSKDILANKVTQEQVEAQQQLIDATKATAAFDLDKALDTFDPSFPGYSPSKHALDMINMMTLVNGKDQEFPSPMAHFFMADLLLNQITDPRMFPYSNEICDTIDINHLRLAFMCSRGIAKSTVVISFFGVYSAIKGELPGGIGKVWFYLVLAASSKGGARVNALAVRAMCEDSRFINDYFENVEYTESETRFLRKGNEPIADRSFLIRYQGAGTGVRGIRAGQRRICAIIMDDIILNEAASYSKTITENLESIIHSDCVAALKGGGKGRIICTFTPFSYTDVNTKLVIEGAYTPCVIPIARNIDIDKDTSVSYKDIDSSWEAMHPARTIAYMIRDAKKSNKLKSFLQERMLRLTSSDMRLVPDNCIQFTNAELIKSNIHAYNVYITSDFTTTSGENSDYSGVAVWALSNNGDWFMLELALRKMGMEEQYRVMMDWAAKYTRMDKYVELGVEIDGNQAAHIFSLERMMAQRGQWYTFAKQKGADKDSTRKGILSRNGGGNKHERFRVAVNNYMLTNKLWFAEHLKDTQDMKDMISQVKGATHETFTRSDDGPDLISMLGQLSVVTPTGGGYASSKTEGYTRSIYSDFGYEEEEEYYGSSVMF